MISRARFLKHPMHPMLIVLPSALFPLLLLFDALQWWTGSDAFWTAGGWLALAGVVSTLVAMVPGIIDMTSIPDGTKAHRVGALHAAIGTTVLVAYVAAMWARWPLGGEPDRFALAAGIDALGVLLVGAQGWLGGELVYKHHMGVVGPGEGGDPVGTAEAEASGPMVQLRRDRTG